MGREQSLDSRLYLITDRHQVPAGSTLLETLEQALSAGVRLVQLREKDLSAAELWPIAQQLRDMTRRYSAQLIINDRIDLALACDADGVHLGAHSLPVAETRKLLGPHRLIGASTHSSNDILNAHQQGADFLTYGPVYYTPSKASFGPPQGLEKLEQACRMSPLPLFALGGVKSNHVQDVMSRGANGIALISAIIASPQPAETARDFLRILS